MTRLSARLAPVVLALAMASPLHGCAADECVEGEARCAGGVAESCVEVVDGELSSHAAWWRTECGARACTLPPGGEPGLAFCALEAEPDPACPDALRGLPDASGCVDGVRRRWRYGYAVEVERCAGEGGCVDVAAEGVAPACAEPAFCASSAAPDPRCAEGVGTLCVDARILATCRCGYVTDRRRCVSPGPDCVPIDVGGGAPPQGACR